MARDERVDRIVRQYREGVYRGDIGETDMAYLIAAHQAAEQRATALEAERDAARALHRDLLKVLRVEGQAKERVVQRATRLAVLEAAARAVCDWDGYHGDLDFDHLLAQLRAAVAALPGAPTPR